jgi:hypothetical protein
MKIKFNIPERYLLLQILPSEGNFATMSLIENFQEILYPTEQEVKEYAIKMEDTVIKWNEKAIEEKEFELSDSMLEFILDIFKKQSDDNKLNFRYYMIYKKISNG